MSNDDDDIQAIETREREIDKEITALQQEKEELSIAKRVMMRLKKHGAASPAADGKIVPRPAGAPSNFEMVDFVLADATVYPFDPSSFELLASRFGVMFFAEPAVSFANMRRALRPSGRMAVARNVPVWPR